MKGKRSKRHIGRTRHAGAENTDIPLQASGGENPDAPLLQPRRQMAGEARNLLCEGLIGKLAPRNDQGSRTGMSMRALPEGSGDV